MKLRFWVKILIAIFILFLVSFLSFVFIYKYNLLSVDKNKDIISFEVKPNSTVSNILKDLSNENLIRSEIFSKIYIKLNNINNIKAGSYDLSSSYNTKEILEILEKGNSTNLGEISITFKEGVNIRKIADLIAENTDNTKEDVFNLVKDKTYLNELINNYWFISEDILNDELYYSIEGYLFPDTYRIYETSSVKEIFKRMFDKMDSVLSLYKEDIENNEFSVHEFLTFASIVQLEGLNEKDMKRISGVFYNRLNSYMTFGSCVTACYGGNVDLCVSDKVPTKDLNPYNTYLDSMVGKLPIGPIGNIGKVAIEAAIYPEKHNYYYFLSDKNMVTYFSRTYTEQQNKQRELVNSGQWLR